MSLRRVGILGGMGPEATAQFFARIIARTDAATDDGHVPLLIDNTPDIPSRITRLIEGHGPDPLPVLVGMARGLQGAGCTALAMPCNTAHAYAGRIAASVSVPFLNMVTLTAARVGTQGPVGVIASPATKLAGVYEGSLAQTGCSAAYPADQDALLGAVKSLKRDGVTEGATATLAAASRDLAARGITTQIVACSEFSMAQGWGADGVTLIDAVDVLVEAVVTFSGAPLRPAS